MGFDRKGNLYDDLKNTATGQLVLICAGAIPGYWMTVFTVDKLGRKPIQMAGFAILTIIFCILGFAWRSLSKIHLLVLYVLAQFFFNFGKINDSPISLPRLHINVITVCTNQQTQAPTQQPS